MEREKDERRVSCYDVVSQRERRKGFVGQEAGEGREGGTGYSDAGQQFKLCVYGREEKVEG